MSNLLVATNNKICLVDSKTKKVENLNITVRPKWDCTNKANHGCYVPIQGFVPDDKIFMPYGITWDDNFYYLLSREPNDCKIKCFNNFFKFSNILVKGLPRDIHQILFYENRLWMVSPLTNSIIIYDLINKEILNFDLIELKFKTDLKKIDIHHFNSILITESNIYVSAHNHKNTSFILKLDKINFSFLNEYKMGNQIHCIFYENNKVYTLDSNGSKKIINNGKEEIEIGCSGYDFLRGLAVSRDHFFVGVFTEGKFRKDRIEGDARIKIINKKNNRQQDEIIIEDSGDLSEIRILDENDFVHNNIIKKNYSYL